MRVLLYLNQLNHLLVLLECLTAMIILHGSVLGPGDTGHADR